MSLELAEAHGLTYALKTDKQPDFITEYVREEELSDDVEAYIVKNISNFGGENFLDYEKISNEIFVLMLDYGAIRSKDTKLAGRYFQFVSLEFAKFRGAFLDNDEVFQESKEIGDRYFSDVFEAIERAAVSGEAIEGSQIGDSDQPINAPDKHFFASEANKVTFLRDSADALENVEAAELSNSVKAQARGHLLAARALADTPEPPIDLIWTILNRANSIAGIGAFFLGLIMLIAAVS